MSLQRCGLEAVLHRNARFPDVILSSILTVEIPALRWTTLFKSELPALRFGGVPHRNARLSIVVLVLVWPIENHALRWASYKK